LEPRQRGPASAGLAFELPSGIVERWTYQSPETTVSAQKLDPWTLEMLMAIAVSDWERMDLAVAMGANVNIRVTRDFLDTLRLRQERILGECVEYAALILQEFSIRSVK
jgi:hypothetical protein